MPIGTSLGSFFNTEMDMHLGLDMNADKEMQIDPGLDSNDQNELPGNPGSAGVIQAGKKDDMPFPDNRDPRTDFNTRFGNLPPSGILNDLKKPNPDIPLARRISLSPSDDKIKDPEPLEDKEPLKSQVQEESDWTVSIQR